MRTAIPLALLPLMTGLPLAAQAPLPADRPVLSVEILVREGARPAWSAQGDWIAFDRQGPDGRYDIHLLELDSKIERCLTCEAYDLRHRHNMSPTWHPSGDYLVFTSQSLSKRLGLGMVDMLTPDRAAHADLFGMRFDGKDFWQLVPSGGALLEPHFSFEGDRLVWSERVAATKSGRWGEWELRVGQFETGKVPRLKKVRALRPPEAQRGLLVPDGFAPNDRSVLVSGNLEEGQKESGSDIYLFDLESKSLERLTHSRNAWDVDAHFSPDGKHIAWTSNSEILDKGSGNLPSYLRRDLWLMAPDGSDKKRLTYFNGTGAPESLGSAYVGDFAWSPGGDRIVVHVATDDGTPRESLYLLRLDPSFRR